MGRREAWSAEKSSSDPRTKSTRWEFSRRNSNIQKLGNENSTDDSSGGMDSKNVRSKRIQTKQYRQKSTTTDIHLYNSRSNLIKGQEGYMVDENLRRDEMDRGGSDVEITINRKSSLKRPSAREETLPKDQVFIKEGNAEILRLVTRGNDEGIYINVPSRNAQKMQSQSQYYMVDNSNKDMLMKRYIDEQSEERMNQEQRIPNEVQQTEFSRDVSFMNQQSTRGSFKQPSTSKGIIESDMEHANSHTSIIQQELEMSLKQQNALLRQILLEKEKLEEKNNQADNLDTQSLPCQSMVVATTQTDHEIGTQTDVIERRRARSENDDSLSEEEYEYIQYNPRTGTNGVYYIKKRKVKKKSKLKTDIPKRRVVVVEKMKRKIRTPIQEETEEILPPRETKTTLLRRLKNGKKELKSMNKSASLKKDILLEISDSLDENKTPMNEQSKYIKQVRTKKITNDEESGNSSDSDIYDEITKDSLEEPSDDDDDKSSKLKIKKSSYLISPNREIYKRETSRERSVHRSNPNSPHSAKRLSRRDSTKETIIKTKTRRQTTSEPVVNKSTNTMTRTSKKNYKALSERTRSEMDILKKLSDEGFDVTSIKGVPRYMEWYFKPSKENKGTSSDNQSTKKSSLKKTNSLGPNRLPEYEVRRMEQILDRDRYKSHSLPRTASPSLNSPRLLREDIEMAKKLSVQSNKNHPLIQHSEHRFESERHPEISKPPSKLPHYLYPETSQPSTSSKTRQKSKENINSNNNNNKRNGKSKNRLSGKQLNASTLEDDHDSGIVMNSLFHSMGRRNPIADKKSVFTIAYDDVNSVNRLRSESDSPNI